VVNVYVNGCAYEFPREKIDRLEDQGAIVKADMVGSEEEAYMLNRGHHFTVEQVMLLMGEDV